MKPRILVVEDDAEIRTLIGMTLSTGGMECTEAVDGPSAQELLRNQRFDLILMDLGLPRGSGFDLVRDIDAAATPVIVLTARTGIGDKVRVFEDGAIDYMTKPFDPMELLLRIKSALRRTFQTEQSIRIGTIVIDPAGRVVTEADSVVRLTPREFDLLLYLARHSGVALTRDQMVTEVWGYDAHASTRTVDVHIGRIRSRFPALPISTVPRIGYRLDVSER